jgi:hypothetical protein
MTEQATAYRPDTRAGGAEPRPTDTRHLRAVPTDPATLQSETETGQENTPPEGSPQVSDHAAVEGDAPDFSFRARFGRFWAASKDYWTPPAILTERPPALADLAAYAKTAPWTDQSHGIIRAFGVAYQRGFAIPYTTWSRTKEHFVQRPLRFAALLAGTKLVCLTGPGDWAVHTLVYPVAQYAGHVFL